MSPTETMGLVRPYGDTTGDGRVQLSFTLPVPFGDETERARAEGAALQLAAKMGLDPAMVVHAKGMGPDFTFFIVYGRVSHLVDLSAVTVTEREFPVLPAAEVNLRIRSALGRKLVVVGACIGTDAHTVGIDAILNVKGHAGEKGLEYYREIRVVNLGSQVGVADLVARAAAEHADAVLVSQVVTQRDAHLTNTREMSAAFHAGFGLQRPLLVVGGPRFDPSAAHDLGVDKIYGRGTTPSEVATAQPASPLGLHRVLDPPGVLPQAAWRLDPNPAIAPDEVRVRVDRLNLDAASYRQLRETYAGDPDKIRAAVLEIIATRGKMQNPVTGSGGMLTGTVEEAGPDSPLGLHARPADRHPGLPDPDPAGHHRLPVPLGRPVRAGALRGPRHLVRPVDRRRPARRPPGTPLAGRHGRLRRPRPDQARGRAGRAVGGPGHRRGRQERLAVRRGRPPGRRGQGDRRRPDARPKPPLLREHARSPPWWTR